MSEDRNTGACVAGSDGAGVTTRDVTTEPDGQPVRSRPVCRTISPGETVTITIGHEDDDSEGMP